MSSDFQRRSRQRKLIYGGLIVALFTATLLYRPHVLERHADTLAVREQDQGTVDPVGAAVRLSLTLTGSRGFALWALWLSAIEKQKRNEWDELDILTRAIMQLQPNFLTPWLFQSWNLAYNVSAESDRVRDKYYWISRGIELLAEGERQNRNHPDLRSHLAMYYMNKIGQGDQQRTLRSLFQMSCIDPKERDPANLRGADGQVDPVKFKAFCENYPHLVRRLREMQGCRTPDEVLDFLGDNWELPSRFEASPRGSSLLGGRSRLKMPEKQFPVLPRPADLKYPTQYEYTADDLFRSDFDNFKAAHIWYTYAQEPLPEAQAVPGPLSLDFDPSKYRLPRAPAAVIFRSFPGISQTLFSERLEHEGWYEHGWEIDAGRQGRDRWFAEKVVAGDQPWSRDAWTRARDLWQRLGRDNGLQLDPSVTQELQGRARLFRSTFGVNPTELDHRLRPEDFDGELRSSFEAHAQLWWYQDNRRKTNFAHFAFQAQAECEPKTIEARTLFFQARRQRKAAAPAEEVVRRYEQAFALWKDVLHRHPEYRADIDVQEFTYRQQAKYLELLDQNKRSPYHQARTAQGLLEHQKTDLKHLLLVTDFLGQGALRPPMPSGWLPPGHLWKPGKLVERLRGPFDDIISELAVERARVRLDPDDLN